MMGRGLAMDLGNVGSGYRLATKTMRGKIGRDPIEELVSWGVALGWTRSDRGLMGYGVSEGEDCMGWAGQRMRTHMETRVRE